MKVCKNCGTENKDDSLYCEQCGSLLEKEEQIPAKDNLEEVAEKAFNGAKVAALQFGDVAGQLGKTINDTIKKQKEKASQEAQKEIAKAQKKPASKKSTSGTKYMSSTELWSWLQKDSKRQHFYTEQENTLTQDEYLEKLQQKLTENQVPAKVQMREVQWDRSSVKQQIYYVHPDSEFVNPLTCMVQFNHVGKFTFVEEKIFITPPKLPEPPQDKVLIPDDLRDKGKQIFWGCVFFLVGLLMVGAFDLGNVGWAVTLIGAVMAGAGFIDSQKLEELIRHNFKCEEQEKAWRDAWSRWQNSIFLHSFQENTNGQISRIYDSVFECIKQLNEELFSEKASTEQQESKSLNELEQMIARRKDEYR